MQNVRACQNTGNASGTERSGCRGFRRTGTAGSAAVVHIDGFLGKEVDYSEFENTLQVLPYTKMSPQAEADIKFGYCTEFIILLKKPMPD